MVAVGNAKKKVETMKAETSLTESQANALSLIKRTGRSTDKRAVKALVKKGFVTVTYEDTLPGSWGEKGAVAYFCAVLEKTAEFKKLSAGCYESKCGRVEINKLPDGSWAWAVDGVGYDAESTLAAAKAKAAKAAQ